MNYLLPLFLAVGATLNVVPPSSADDAGALQGSWRPTSAELGGQKMPDAVLKLISLKLENGRYEVMVGEAPDRGSYAIEPGATPKGMSVTGSEGPNAGLTFPAIYELAGDTLRICYDLSGAARPTEFKSVAGTKLYLVTYTRQK